MTKEIMDIWDTLTPDEQATLRMKAAGRGAFIADGKRALTIHLHADDNDMWIKGEELGFTGDALSNFSRIGYEVSLDIEVDEWGEAMLISVGGSKLNQAIEI
jgi:hypothetical protein